MISQYVVPTVTVGRLVEKMCSGEATVVAPGCGRIWGTVTVSRIWPGRPAESAVIHTRTPFVPLCSPMGARTCLSSPARSGEKLTAIIWGGFAPRISSLAVPMQSKSLQYLVDPGKVALLQYV
jgi:hypothetical protein